MATFNKRKNGQKYTREGVVVTYDSLVDDSAASGLDVAGLPKNYIVTGFTVLGTMTGTGTLTVKAGGTSVGTATVSEINAGKVVPLTTPVSSTTAGNLSVTIADTAVGHFTALVDFFDGDTTNGLRTEPVE